ncbi:MAG: DcaP family trimeric outer membrane transporter [Candidatus Manganitrophus sp.]|nr:DcaP family trimeric outer membrane transporter [Candidatus Manganitrophus sp.]MDC4223974.1 DcaP family trimeric outer membrane transporter [Candidatus Manganitrophus sp.]WDT71824.1 MAG: DcaP family trimeric outer membrane transporter [Candidatus Manganitrophus sp.]WDT80792.1 MAG: DcaP family trimeric outer membrane transporter [Candidatus Manganitrophus sp.]
MTKKIAMIIALAVGLFAAALPFSAAEAAEGPPIDIYGFVQMDAIYDFNSVDPNWEATLRPSRIPVNCSGLTPDAGCGEDGNTLFSVRQSRFGAKADFPTDIGQLQTKFEFDLFGVGADEGQTTIRLRHAYGELGPFLAGQTNSLFMDGDVFPNTVDYWGPGGMVFFRNIQFRWTPLKTDHQKFAVALENPGSALDVGNAARPEGWEAWNHYPDVTAQYRIDHSWGHAQVAGIGRWLGYQNPTIPTGRNSGHELGGGVNLSGSLKTFGKNKLMAQVAYGRGIAAYFNDCCTDLAPNGALTEGEAVPLLGWLVYYDHYWSERWSSSIGYSAQNQDNTDGQADDAFNNGAYASGNLLWSPTKEVTMGTEVLWGQRENKDGEKGEDTRVQFSAKYNF